MDQIPLQEVQGLILCGYGMDALCVFVLRVEHTAQARLLLADLPVTIATIWDNKPDFCLNVAITYEGLGALGLTQRLLESFPDEFKQGAVARARNVGDTGQSAPENWKGGLAGPGVHVLVLLFAQNSDIREEQSQWLQERWREAMSEVSSHDAYNLPGNLAHFGFRDRFSQRLSPGRHPTQFRMHNRRRRPANSSLGTKANLPSSPTPFQGEDSHMPPAERLGLSQPVGVAEQHGQVVEPDRHVGMIRAEALFING
jgi:hypothetical protein